MALYISGMMHGRALALIQTVGNDLMGTQVLHPSALAPSLWNVVHYLFAIYLQTPAGMQLA